MLWRLSNRGDQVAREIADRHYNRQKPGTPQFVPPGRCLVLVAPGALWVTSWPFAEYVKHAWAGAWVNCLFRKECDGKASDFILDAVAATRHYFGDPPPQGMITFVDPRHVPLASGRSFYGYGYSYFKAGFDLAGFTKGGLWAWQLRPHLMPRPCAPIPKRGHLFT